MKTTWPVVKRYDADHLLRITLPLGGIGTGTVSLGGRGNLRDWEIVNRPAKGFTPGPAFFALWAKAPGQPAVTKAMEGPIDPAEYEGASGSPAQNHGLPRFRKASFAAAYPLGQVLLSDPEVPLGVTMQAFNPLVPTDADSSGIPVAIVRFVLHNRGARPVEAAVCAVMPNFVGMDGSQIPPATGCAGNLNELRDGGIFMRSAGVPAQAEQWGTMALALAQERGGPRMRVSHRTAWAKLSWGDSLLDFWDDFSADGAIEERAHGPGVDMPTASLAARVTVKARDSIAVTFLVAWHYPNRMTWTPAPATATGAPQESCDCGDGGCRPKSDPNRIGNHYATRFQDAWAVVEHVRSRIGELEERTVAFVRALASSDLPEVVKEAALFTLPALRSQTSFRLESGELVGFEGCGDRQGCCHGSCTHVWNYEVATAFLFGSLSRSMREIEFGHAVHDNGLMSFRVNLPLSRAREYQGAAADGQMGCFIKLFRDWQLSGHTDMLRRLWPQVRRAMEFAWIPGGWDADRDGVMEGCQHNTMDVEYYGPNPQMQGWYLGALRACEEMARAVGDEGFAQSCRSVFEQGSRWTDRHLWNGEYYEHEIRPPMKPEAIAAGLRVGMGAANWEDPELQLGAGCLVDQLVGQELAHVAGLGYLLDPAHVKKALKSILKHNTRHGFFGHFNHMRSYALGEESAMLMASYPRGRRPRRPFPYYNEVMTGFEYAAAVHMVYEGMRREGLERIAAIRERYDGRRRSPFDEAECGHYYARAMASWAAIPALTGFHYSAVEQRMRFAAAPGNHFWSTGDAWGTCRIAKSAGGFVARLSCLGGRVSIRKLDLDGVGSATAATDAVLHEGASARFSFAAAARAGGKRARR